MAKHQFNGTEKLEGKIFNLPTSSYYIEIILNDKDYRSDFSYSASTPPMPINIGGWAIMKKAIDSYFVFNSENKVGTNILFKQGDYNTIKISADKRVNKTYFYLNDEQVSVKESFTPLKSFYRLGTGYKKRFWIGTIKKVSINKTNDQNQLENILLL